MILKAVIYEGMRKFPPVISGFEKTVPPGGDTSESCLFIWHICSSTTADLLFLSPWKVRT